MSLFVVVWLFSLQECYFLSIAHTPLDRFPNTKRSDWTIIKLFLWVYRGQSISYRLFCMVPGLNISPWLCSMSLSLCLSLMESSQNTSLLYYKARPNMIMHTEYSLWLIFEVRWLLFCHINIISIAIWYPSL